MIREEVRKNWGFIELDLNAEGVLPSVKNLQPLIFKDSNSVCVMERHSPMDGIFGCGKTTQEAMAEFASRT